MISQSRTCVQIEAFQLKSSRGIHHRTWIQFIFKYVVNMDSEVTNPKYELIWTNSSSDNQFLDSSAYDLTHHPEFCIFQISRKLFHLAERKYPYGINFLCRIQICNQKEPKNFRKYRKFQFYENY